MKQKYLTELAQDVVKWAEARELLNQDGTAQFLKWGEEFGEYCGAAVRNKDQDKIKDGIGDTLVTVIIWACQNNWKLALFNKMAESKYGELAEPKTTPPAAAAHISLCMGLMFTQRNKALLGDVCYYLNEMAHCHGFTLYECLEFAYEEISGRKGKTVDGAFIKESDL